MGYKVSILVPIYGVEKYIERCARSLFEQTYHNIEYVFVNDCTKDNSIDILLAVLAQYPNRKGQVKVIHHEHNKGLSGARNTAIANMTGDYLWHVDSDDYISTNAVELLLSKIQETNADVVIMGQTNVYQYKTEIFAIKQYDKHEYIKQLLLSSIGASMWNKFYKSSFYKQIGILSIEGIGQGEDFAVVPRILHYASKIEWLNEPLYFYNLANQSSYSNNISVASIKSLKKANDIIYDFFKDIEIYKEVVEVLHLRSMLFLIKTSCKDRYNDIINTYNNVDLRKVTRKISLSDKLVLFLIRMRWFGICESLVSYRRKRKYFDKKR